MPKYVPQDVNEYDIRPCPVCGQMIEDFSQTVCSEYCNWMLYEYEHDQMFFDMVQEDIEQGYL